MTTHVPLPGSKRILPENARLAGEVDPTAMASLTIRVRSGSDKKTLEQQVLEQSQLPLADRAYLSHEDYAQQYGATTADLDLVEALAQRHHLLVTHRSPAERSIVLKGTLADLLNAFPANVRMYHHAAGGTYRGRHGEIHIPQELEHIVTGVFGFDTCPKERKRHRHTAMDVPVPPLPPGLVPMPVQTITPVTVFAERYRFPKDFNGQKLDGSGQTIAIIELGGGYRTDDLQIYCQKMAVPMPNISAISVDHAQNLSATSNPGDGEVMMDIEVACAVAPMAKYAVYFGQNNGEQGFLDVVSAAVHDAQRKPCIISISWGGPEALVDQHSLDEFHQVFLEAAALGITVCVSSGDHGTADMAAADWDKNIHVTHPASDDFVLACGGTQIDTATDQDVVWNDGTPFDAGVGDGGGWASGGGVSAMFAVPSYQAKANLPTSLASGKSGRGLPDIAMCAVNYATRFDGYDGVSGGTSAVAPLMAALVALLNQAKRKNVGFLNPFLYANAAAGIVHEVTSGTNAIKDTVKGYEAGPGWNACTGLGTPDGAAILAKL